jgi:MoxR-like ATPase
MVYPSIDEEEIIIDRNMTLQKFEAFDIKSIFSQEDIVKIQQLVKHIHMDEKIKKYLVRLVDATRNPKKYNLKLATQYVNFGASPRGSISLFIASKAHALMRGRTFVTHKDIKEICPHVLRHRVLLNFEGQAEGVSPEDIVAEIIKNVPII